MNNLESLKSFKEFIDDKISYVNDNELDEACQNMYNETSIEFENRIKNLYLTNIDNKSGLENYLNHKISKIDDLYELDNFERDYLKYLIKTDNKYIIIEPFFPDSTVGNYFNYFFNSKYSLTTKRRTRKRLY